MKALVLALSVLLLGCASPGGTVVEGDRPDAARDVRYSTNTGALRIAVVGLVHGHAEGLLWNAQNRGDIELVGVYEPNRELFDRLSVKYGIDAALRYDDLGEMLDAARPEAASIMTSTADHAGVIEACASRGVHTLVEKPLAFTSADARRIRAAAIEHRVLVLTNYETSWYASVREAGRLVDAGEMAPIRRMAFRHGHAGPREIGCSEEFLAWLTDPDANGGGAITDFGCYGAALSVWMMDGQRPTSVTATASTLKPAIYPRVDDDATIVLEFDGATSVIQASWAWTHDNKEMEVYTERGSIHAGKWDELSVRAPNQSPTVVVPPALPEMYANEWTYLRHVVRGECPVDPLSDLELNITVSEILDEARRQTRR